MQNSAKAHFPPLPGRKDHFAPKAGSLAIEQEIRDLRARQIRNQGDCSASAPSDRWEERWMGWHAMKSYDICLMPPTTDNSSGMQW